MKKQLLAGAISIATIGAACAQGLYDIAPNDDAQESLPIKWSAGVTFGYDDNATPTVQSGPGEDDGLASVTAYVGASLVHITPQTTWDVYARLGVIHYFDNPGSEDADQTGSDSRLGFNWTHRVSERLRFSSRNYVAYEQEPDLNVGIVTDRQTGEYLNYSSDNSIGYRWSERFATVSGFKIRGLDFSEDFGNNDRFIYSFYNQIRYRASEQTVWTLGYRYRTVESEGSASDSSNHIITGGIEHRFSPNSILALKAGAQIRDVDGGDNSTNPFLEAAIRTRVNEQFSLRAFARYSVEDYGTSFGNGNTYDNNNTLRIGVTGNYIVSPDLSVYAGLNFIQNDFEDGRSTNGGPDPDDLDQDLINLFVGFSYRINDGVYLTGSYNFTDSDASGGPDQNSSDSRTYDRNNVNLGVRFDF